MRAALRARLKIRLLAPTRVAMEVDLTGLVDDAASLRLNDDHARVLGVEAMDRLPSRRRCGGRGLRGRRRLWCGRLGAAGREEREESSGEGRARSHEGEEMLHAEIAVI
jgi:hypothetical protein